MSAGTGGVGSTVSSARPEDLHRYRDDVVRRHGLVERSLRHVEQAAAAYAASCPEVPVSTAFLRTLQEPLGQLRALAARVADVGDAFLLADTSPTGGLARTTDGAMARIVVDRHPALANATVLGSLADELAEQVAGELDRAAEDGRTDLSDLRASVPAALLADPRFARSVLRQLDADRLAVVVDQLALEAPPGRPTADLRWLGDLFALGASGPAGHPIATLAQLLETSDGRTAVRILRTSSSLHLPAPTVEAIALATAVLHPSSADGGHRFLRDARDRDVGDDAVLIDAARVPGLALRLLTGAHRGHPDEHQVQELVAAAADGSQRGLTALLAAARRDPGRRDAHRALTEAGRALLHGTVAELGRLPRAGLTTDDPRAPLVRAATAILADDPLLAVAHTRSPDDPADRAARLDVLASALQHAAEDGRSWTLLLDGRSARRLEAMRTSVATGDAEALELTARLDGLLTRAAERADAPDRRLDPVLDGATDASARFLTDRYGAAGAAISSGIAAAASWAGDELAGEPGTAGERLEAGGSAHADRVLAVVDALPGRVVWAGSGVGSRGELVAALREDGGGAVLEQWELAQGPEVHAELGRLQRRYRAALDAAP